MTISIHTPIILCTLITVLLTVSLTYADDIRTLTWSGEPASTWETENMWLDENNAPATWIDGANAIIPEPKTYAHDISIEKNNTLINSIAVEGNSTTSYVALNGPSVTTPINLQSIKTAGRIDIRFPIGEKEETFCVYRNAVSAKIFYLQTTQRSRLYMDHFAISEKLAFIHQTECELIGPRMEGCDILIGSNTNLTKLQLTDAPQEASYVRKGSVTIDPVAITLDWDAFLINTYYGSTLTTPDMPLIYMDGNFSKINLSPNLKKGSETIIIPDMNNIDHTYYPITLVHQPVPMTFHHADEDITETISMSARCYLSLQYANHVRPPTQTSVILTLSGTYKDTPAILADYLMLFGLTPKTNNIVVNKGDITFRISDVVINSALDTIDITVTRTLSQALDASLDSSTRILGVLELYALDADGKETPLNSVTTPTLVDGSYIFKDIPIIKSPALIKARISQLPNPSLLNSSTAI